MVDGAVAVDEGMIQKIDDYLIDLVFQPISDRLARWVSCYEIAQFLLVGSSLIFVSVTIYYEAFLGGALTVPWAIFLYWRASKLQNTPINNVLPIERAEFCMFRVCLIISEPVWLILFYTSTSYYLLVRELGWIIIIVALYFMACRRNPPKPKAVKATWDQTSWQGNAS